MAHQTGPRPGAAQQWRPTGKRKSPRWSSSPPPCPDWLTPAAKTVFRRTLRELKAAGLLARVDGELLAGYATCYADLAVASEQLDREGMTVSVAAKDSHGRPTGGVVLKPHPLVAVKSDLLGRLRMYAESLGLTVISRMRQNGETDAEVERPGNRVLQLREEVRRAREGGAP